MNHLNDRSISFQFNKSIKIIHFFCHLDHNSVVVKRLNLAEKPSQRNWFECDWIDVFNLNLYKTIRGENLKRAVHLQGRQLYAQLQSADRGRAHGRTLKGNSLAKF